MFNEEDMELAVQDYVAGLSVMESASMNNVDPFDLLAKLKWQGISSKSDVIN